MKSTSQTGGRCEEQGTKAGMETEASGGAGGGLGGGKKVAPWAAGMYEKIKAFEIDRPGDAFPFSARLASENGWSRAHALKVIEEYRRFVCLMATAAHPVTPSEAVDQAWHLHMTYTRSYWDGLCKEVVGRPLHHDPTRGGSDESAKFTDWYARTLETYRRAFGLSPPADIWPAPQSRFAPSRMQWVDLAEFKLVRREPRRGRGWMWLGLGATAAVTAGCAGGTGGGKNWIILVVILVVFGLIAAVMRAARGGRSSRSRRRRTDSGSTGCSSAGFFPFWGGSGDSDPDGHGGPDGGGHGGDGGGGGDGDGGGGGGGCSGGGCGGGGCGGGGD